VSLALPAGARVNTEVAPKGAPGTHAESWAAGGLAAYYVVGPRVAFAQTPALACTAVLDGRNARFDADYSEGGYSGQLQSVYAVIELRDGRTLKLTLASPKRDDEAKLRGILRTVRFHD
jgi:hypothetical protein